MCVVFLLFFSCETQNIAKYVKITMDGVLDFYFKSLGYIFPLTIYKARIFTPKSRNGQMFVNQTGQNSGFVDVEHYIVLAIRTDIKHDHFRYTVAVKNL